MQQVPASILRFMLKALAMTLPVLLPAVLFYLWADPFRVLTSDTRFYDTSPAVGLNKGMVTLRNYEKQLRDGRSYNAFIFGSSITCYYDTDDWKELLGGDSIAPYHFDSSSESIEQMAEKVDYLDRTGAHIDHALIVLDPIIMGKPTDDSPMSIHPPALSRSPLHALKYHYTFFRGAVNIDFLRSWLPGMLEGAPLFIGRNPVFETQPIRYNPLTNQESLPQWDSLISADPKRFYAEHPLLPSPAHTTPSAAVLTPERQRALRSIADIFRRRHTDYRVIVGPNRRKVTLNLADYAALCRIFGNDRVSDFSLSLAPDLEQDTLLYDNTHYRPAFARKLMRLAYPN